jgi:alkanesulfonate monooxygenase SsuD/methylene tetrahydromethanopterin reductase-like flavin-dependent oxidoreductase (luciferase family)
VLDRQHPVSHEGKEISLPYRGPGALGQGKALKSILHPAARVPIWLAAGGPLNTELAAELCDGWLPMGLGSAGVAAYDEPLARGLARRTAGPAEKFEIFSGCSVRITDDVQGVLDSMRPLTAMYVGGMGSQTHNYHRESMARRGFPEEAERIGELWRAGRKQEAMAAVPDEYLQMNALLGSPQRIRDRWKEVLLPGVTGMIIGADQLEALELIADLAGTRDLVDADE